MGTTTIKPKRFLSSGFIRMKVKAATSRAEKKRLCEAYMKQMEAQRLEQKRTRSTVEDTDDAMRYLKGELEYLNS